MPVDRADEFIGREQCVGRGGVELAPKINRWKIREVKKRGGRNQKAQDILNKSLR